jgi:hypothetical protein
MAKMLKSEYERGIDAVMVVSVWYTLGPPVLIMMIVALAVWSFAWGL